jgi:hypothetical protein
VYVTHSRLSQWEVHTPSKPTFFLSMLGHVSYSFSLESMGDAHPPRDLVSLWLVISILGT